MYSLDQSFETKSHSEKKHILTDVLPYVLISRGNMCIKPIFYAAGRYKGPKVP